MRTKHASKFYLVDIQVCLMKQVSVSSFLLLGALSQEVIDNGVNTTATEVVRRAACTYDFMEGIVQYAGVKFLSGEPQLTNDLMECTYYNKDISCCSRDTEKSMINVIKDTQVRFKELKKENLHAQREALIRGRLLAMTERLAEKEYTDVTELNAVDESFKSLLEAAAELQDLISKTYQDDAFYECLTEMMFTAQDLSCSLCSPAVGEFSSNEGYLFMKSSLCNSVYDKCGKGFAQLRDKRVAVDRVFKDVRLAAKRARGEELLTNPPVPPAKTNITQPNLEELTPSERRALVKTNIILDANNDSYYSSAADPLALPQSAILRDEYFGDSETDNFCRHYFGNVSPLHMVTLLELERSFAVDAVLIAEQEAYSSANAQDQDYVHIKNILRSTGYGQASFLQQGYHLSEREKTSLTSSFIALSSAVENFSPKKKDRELLSQLSSLSTLQRLHSTTPQSAKMNHSAGVIPGRASRLLWNRGSSNSNNRFSVSEDFASSASSFISQASSTDSTGTSSNSTSSSNSTEVPEVTAEEASSNSTATNSTADASVNALGLDASYGILHAVARELSVEDRSVMISGYRSFLNQLQLLKPSSSVDSDSLINREYYSNNSPHIDSFGDPCVTTHKEVCFFPMDETPDGTIEQIKSGKYKAASQTCASGEGQFGWCWTGPPLTQEDVLKNKKTRPYGLCSAACKNQHVVMAANSGAILIDINVKTPAGYTLDVVGNLDSTVNNGKSKEDASTSGANSVVDFQTGPNGVSLKMGDIFYQPLKSPKLIYSDQVGVVSVSRSNRTVYEAESIDGVVKPEESSAVVNGASGMLAVVVVTIGMMRI